jgi:hypothetical protein
MERGRAVRLGLGFAASGLLYCFVSGGLFVGIAMSECLPRSSPLIHLCDAEKRREVLLYVLVFGLNLLITPLVVCKRSAEAGIVYLTASSVLPFFIVTAFAMVSAAISR